VSSVLLVALTWECPSLGSAQERIGTRISGDDLDVLHALTRDAPEEFAGVTVDEKRGVATVYVVDSRYSGAFKRLYERTHQRLRFPTDDLEIEYKVVARDQSSLERVKEDITSNQSWAERVGGKIYQWGVSPDKNVVSVGVEEVTPELERAANERFGSSVELFETAPTERTASRVHDIQPFWGGSPINDGTSLCSSGFAVFSQINGQRGMLTAGHCGALDANIFHDGQFFGKLTARALTNNGFDRGIVLNATYDPLIWTGSFPPTGPFNSTSAEFVVSFRLVTKGQSVCVDGSQHGEICGVTVGDQDICRNFPNTSPPNTCHLTRVEKSGTIIIGGGDSGGPVFARVTGGVSAVGIIVAKPTDNASVGFIHEMRFALGTGWQLLTR
jgi:hypothetical protein